LTPTLILASTSPRRRELLSGLGLRFSPFSPGTEEIPLPGELPPAYVQRNARLKAEAALPGLREAAHGVIVAADTIVVLDDAILEKPRDADDAEAMLKRLSGRSHTVYTGLCVLQTKKSVVVAHEKLVGTKVLMKGLSPTEIKAYVATGEPLDKAGSYAAQGLGGYMVREVHGSFSNVVGLPLTELVEILTSHCGISIFAS